MPHNRDDMYYHPPGTTRYDVQYKAEHWRAGSPRLRFVADDQRTYGGFGSLSRIAMQCRRKYEICASRYIKSFE